MKSIANLAFATLLIIPISNCSWGHDGPDPTLHWQLNSRSISGDRIVARLGPDATIDGEVSATSAKNFQALSFDGKSLAVVADDFKQLNRELFPQDAITISAVFSIEKGKDYGGIIGVLQDNGGDEKGWILGYNRKHFYFGLSTEGANDGDGLMTYLHSDRRFEYGKLYHVVAVYDGQTMQVFVNGTLSGESSVQSGKILYPNKAPFVIGGYKDDNEDFRHQGRVANVAVYDLAAKPEWVAKEFAHHQSATELPPVGAAPVELAFAVQPFLQYATQDSITVMFESTKATLGMVQHGEDASVPNEAKSDARRYIHEVKLTGLRPETQYFYQAKATDSDGKTIESEVLTFQTASGPQSPFSFAVISDTQGNPEVSGKLANYAWNYRPNFLLHPGDLVSTGSNDRAWLEQFFRSMNPLISRVAMFPVLGNHEQNAQNYYNYMSLPEPEYYYSFKYGNAEFFMLDTNKNVDPNSEQYQWLDEQLGQSSSKWKIVCHHHPAYSSDENDYGNLWKTNQSSRGDKRVRQLTVLYDKHNVDIVWSGHIHSYERTWSVRGERVVEQGKGPVYMVTGGGGGHLETAGPFRPAFQNNVRRGHHYCMVAINGGTLEFKAFDLENRLFDYFKMEK